MRLPRRPARRQRPAIAVPAGERLLAWTGTPDGPVGGTRDALYLPGGTRLPWERVEAARWDEDAAELVVTEVGAFGQPRPEHRYAVEDPGRLVQLVRERVTASIVLQRHIAVGPRGGLTVIARRAPSGDRALTWLHEYDEGVDPRDPAVREVAEQALAAVRAEVETG